MNNLCHAGNAWWRTFAAGLRELGWHPSLVHPAIYYRDSATLGAPRDFRHTFGRRYRHRGRLRGAHQQHSHRLLGRNAGPPGLVLGMLVEQDHETRTITLSQRVMVEEAVRCFDLHGSAPSKCPLLPRAHLVTDAPPLSHVHATEFRSIVGTLQYIASMTRPDITFAATLLARYMAAPTHLYIDAAHKTLLYVKGTARLKLVIGSLSFYLAGVPTPSLGRSSF